MLVGLVLAVGIGAYVTIVGDADGQVAEESGTEEPPNTEAVIRTDLVELEEFDGTLQAVEEQTIASTTSGIITAVASEGSSLGEGDLVYAVDGTAVPMMLAPTDFSRDLSLGDDTFTVEAPRSGTITSAGEPGALVEQGDVLYTFDGEPVTVLYGDTLGFRDLYWPERPETTPRSTLAADEQSAQTRARLVEAITNAEDHLDEVRLSTPSVALLNAIDDLTRISDAGGSDTEVSRANQAVTAAQNADLDRIEAAEEAVEQARQALADFEAVEAAAARDEAANDSTREADPNLVGIDVLQLETALVAMGFDPDGEVTVDREFTAETEAMVERWEERLGVEVDGIVEVDDIVFVPGPAQIVDIIDSAGAVGAGTPTATLSLGGARSGADVLQLEQALARMGFATDAMVVDDVFDAETRQALLEWQTATGQRPDGVLHIGDVVVAETLVRVTSQMAPVGTQVAPGSPVLAASDVEQIVSFDLDAADQSLADEGDRVNVILPDDVEVAGTIEEIATTATTTPDGTTVFAVTVRLDEPDAVGDLTEAPVTVELVGSSVTDVLAVPVSSLIALTGGGYAIEADSGSGFRLVSVEPGFFADGLVEIDVNGVDVGDQVTLP